MSLVLTHWPFVQIRGSDELREQSWAQPGGYRLVLLQLLCLPWLREVQCDPFNDPISIVFLQELVVPEVLDFHKGRNAFHFL